MKKRIIEALFTALITLNCAMPEDVRAESTQISDGVVRIGVLNDRSGPLADLSGEGSVVAARLAAEEFGNAINGVPIEIVSADHQNKADIGAAIARRWFEVEQVDAIADITNSAVGFAVTELARTRTKILLNASASSDFTGKACSPTSVQWVYNSFTNGHGLASALTKPGSDTWFLLTVDYAFGHSFAAEIRKAVEASGGKIVEEVRYPLNTADFSSFLLRGQGSGAQVVALITGGADLVNSVKQANEFQISKVQNVVAPVVYLTDVDAMGLSTAQGLQFVTAFYWNRDEASRQWSKKFFAKHGRMPTMAQAGTYSAVRHYLRAIQATNSDDGLTVIKKMRELPISDAYAANGVLRADGQMVHDMYVARVKKPSDSSGRWDYYDIVSTIPGDMAYRSLEQSECPLLKK
jgi:branched-chain amino acid transport system substrate-binding protein